MADIHHNWLIRHHEGDDKAALVKAAKAPKTRPAKERPERAVKAARAETRKGR